jgi:glutathione S-transferase
LSFYLLLCLNVPTNSKNEKRPTVPIIEDLAHENMVVQDSWDIALYLEEAYPDTPSLFHGNAGLHKFFYDYSNDNIIPHVFKLVVLHVASNTGSEKVNAWFRDNREKRFGVTLEQFAGEASQNIAALKKGLLPIHSVLKQYPFMTGEKGKVFF